MPPITTGSVVHKFFQAMGVAEADIFRIVAPTGSMTGHPPSGQTVVPFVYRGADQRLKHLIWTETASGTNMRLLSYSTGGDALTHMLHVMFPKTGTEEPFILEKWQDPNPRRVFRRGETPTTSVGLGIDWGVGGNKESIAFSVHRIVEEIGGSIDPTRLKQEWTSVTVRGSATAVNDPLIGTDPTILALLVPPEELHHQVFDRTDRLKEPFFGVQKLLDVPFEAARLVFDGPDSILVAEADMVPILRQAFTQADASKLTIEAANGESTVRFGWRINDIFWPDFRAPQ